ncbi:hypothetical protein CG723_19895 [Streptomyces sp. CB01635]|uniref:hypothetical protein n=1 Tax=unclassified Streptomyces TaxID=2593676 RepID=UPI000C274003|nr:hypothetical protein [Streptomyces sp. CB01635]PJN09989.1 hypothetical protein CG723_19895 [Streptomyces sp. CB01635]
MPRHDFQPGKLIAGLFLTAAGALYLGAALGGWEVEWFAVIPLVTVGLVLAGAAGTATYAIRRRQRPHPTDSSSP